MNNFPLVSIIINCKNGEKFLKESLESVFKQTYKNWEIIFFDNFSTDNSKLILNRFKDKRIKYFYSSKHLTLYSARNKAIDHASGKYICFLDVDDKWKKNKLEVQINFLKKNKSIKILYSNYYNFFNKKKKKKIKYKSYLPEGNITQALLNNYCIAILTLCIEKSVFKKNKFNEKYNIIGDFDLIIKLSKFFKIACIQEPLASYRLHEINFSKKNKKMYFQELKMWLKFNRRKLKNDGYNLNRLILYFYKLKFIYFLSLLRYK